MTDLFDPSGDFADIADGLASATLTRAGDPDDVTVLTGVLQRTSTTGEARLSEGEYLRSAARFHLPADQLSSPPVPGDAVTDESGETWIVQEVVHSLKTGRYVATALAVEIVADLGEQIVIERAGFAKDDDGTMAATWSSVRRLAASIRETGMTPESGRTRRLFEIVLADDMDLSPEYRVRDSRGSLYRILSSTRKEDITGLQVVTATTWS